MTSGKAFLLLIRFWIIFIFTFKNSTHASAITAG